MKKSVITLLIFLIMIISVTAVSAAEDASDLGAADTDALSIDNTDTAIADVSVKNFTELNNAIAEASSQAPGELTLSSDYERNGTTDYGTITVTDLTIDGNGSKINAYDNTVIFETTGNVVLKNMIFNTKGGNAISASGSLTLDNVTFNSVSGSNFGISAMGCTITVKNSVFNGSSSAILCYPDVSLSLSNNIFYQAAEYPIALIEGAGSQVTSPTTINVTATKGNDWNKIKYNISAYDDNGNWIFINEPSYWTLKVNDVATTATTADGRLVGTTYATKYGNNTISASSSVLADATSNVATVNIVPPETDTIINLVFSPDTTNLHWNDTVNLTISINNFTSSIGNYTAKGKVNLYISGIVNQDFDLDENGTVKYTIDNLAVGDYEVVVTYNAQDIFKYNQTTASFTVKQKEPTINITVDNTTNIGHPVITVVMPSDAEGFINATIGTTQVANNGELEDGKYTFTVDLTPQADPFTIVINYTTKYASSNYTNVTGKEFKFIADYLSSDVIINVENTTYGNNVSFTINLAAGIDNATVIITKDNAAFKEMVVNLTSGSATVDLGAIAAGEYNITVNSIPNDVYKVSTNSTLFKVAQIKPDVEITVGDYVLFENVTVTVTVKNYKNGTVTLFDNAAQIGQEVVLDENGTAKFTIESITVGTHTIEAVFTPTTDVDNYTTASNSKDITVAKLTPTINVTVGTVNIDGPAYGVINLTNGDKPAPAGKIYITNPAGDIILDPTPLNNGVLVGYLPASLFTELGDYTIKVYYSADENYTSTNKEYTINVTKWNLKYTVKVDNFTTLDDVVLNVTAGVAGAPAFQGNFTVKVIGVNNGYANITDVKLVPGVEKALTYKLPAGEYKLAVSYTEDDKYFGNSTISDVFIVRAIIENLTVTVDNVTYPENATVIVNASVNGSYNVTVNNKTYTVIVENNTGKVTIDRLDYNATAYIATVVSTMDAYKQTSNFTEFFVKQGTINATLTIENVVYGNNATAVVSATVDGNYTVKVNGVDTIVTVVNGTGSNTIKTDDFDVNVYTCELWSPVNGNYSNSDAEVNYTKFNVTNADIAINVTVADVKYPNAAIVIINATADGKYSVKVAGQYWYTVVVVNGTGNTTLDVLTPKDNIRVQVNATIANYNPVTAETSYNVEKGDLIFNITIPDVYYVNATTGNATGTLNTNVPGFNASDKAGYEITLVGGNFTVYINGNDTDKGFTLPILPVGEYTVKVTPIANDSAFIYYNVEGVYNTTTFNVYDGSINLTVSVASPVVYPNYAKVNITTNITGEYTLTMGDFIKPLNLTAGNTLTVDLPVVTPNRYTVTVSCEIANYTSVYRSATFIVNTGDISATLAIASVAYGTQPLAIITCTENVTGAFTVKVNGKDYTVNVVNGNGNTTLDALYVGQYTATWGADLWPNYNYFDGTPVTFDVVPAVIDLTANVSEVAYPDHAVVTVYANASGLYNITIDDYYTYTVSIETTPGVVGSASKELTLLTAAQHSIKVDKVDSNGNYTVTTPVDSKFNVTKGIPKITINVDDVYPVLENVTITLTVPYGTGTLNITDSKMGTVNATAALINGKATQTIVGVTGIGVHTIFVTLTDDNYVTRMEQTSFNVTALPTSLDINVNDTVYEDDVIVTLNITGLLNGTAPTGNIVIANYSATAPASADEITFNLGKLAAGDYTLSITYEGDDIYAGCTVPYSFTVEKFTPTVNATATGAVYPDNATVKFISNRTGNFTIIVFSESEVDPVLKIPVGIVNNDTEKVVNIAGLTAGQYTASVTYIGDENYTTVVVNTTKFSIKQGVITIDANVTGANYPYKATVDVIATQNGTYTITVIDKDGNVVDTQTGDLVADKVTTAILGLIDAGDYTVNVTFDSANFTAEPLQKSLTIAKGAPIILMAGFGADYPSTGSVMALSSASGEFIVTVGTYTTAGVFTAGELVNITLPVLAAGEYDVVLDYIGNANYNASIKTSNLTINKGTPFIVLDVDTIVAGENANLLIYIENATGIVTVNGNNVELVDGFATYNIGILKPETYDLTAVYGGDTNYTVGNETLTFTVFKLPANLVVTVTNVTYGTNPEYSITLDDKEDLEVKVIFDGVYEDYLHVTNGSKSGHIGNINPGDHNWTVVYKGSEMYEAETQTVYFTMSKAETTIDIKATSPVAGENATITVTLPENATGTVEVKYGNGVYNATVENGVAVISVPTNAAGTENATVKYSGDKDYAPASAEVEITVEPAPPSGIIIAENIKRGVNSPFDYYATLVDANGQPISGVEITFTIEGQTYTAITNDSGIATVSAGLGLVNDTDTVYNVIVTNPYTLENVTATTTIVPRLIVISGDLTADYLENPPYVVQAIGDDGNPVGANQTVRVVFAGFYYDLQTNATGHVVRTIGLAPGMYAVKACYEGYNTTATIFKVKQVMRVTSGTLKKTAKSYTLKATLKSSNGKAIVGKEVKLTFNGKTYTAKTNSKGVASVTIKSSVISKLQAGKTYVLKAKYVNDVAKGKIRVVKK